MNHPAELKYASTHEWVRIEGDLVVTGISGEQAGVVESVKTASDIHAPVSGVVVEINPDLEDDPDFINDDPYGKGWIYKIKPDNMADVEKLLSNTEYEAGL